MKPPTQTLELPTSSLLPLLPLSLLLSTFPSSGEWVNGVISGIGTLFIANGDKYTGEWKDGKMHGRKGGGEGGREGGREGGKGESH